MKRLLVIGVAAMAAAVALADGETWQSRAPIQDTFVNYATRDTAYGDNAGIIVGNSREGCMMFDVSGLANVTAAKIKLYISQCGTTDGVKWPVYFRVMRNDTWNEATLTWNLLPDEFRVAPSPILATNDVTLAGYAEIPAGSQGSWLEVDVTEGVRTAASRGRLALHIYTYQDNNSGDSTPLIFLSSNNADASLHPVLEFQGEETALKLIEDAFIERANPNSNFGTVANGGERSGAIVVERGRREGLMKFDLSTINAQSVASAKLRVRTNDQTATGNTIQLQIVSDDWSEGAVTWNNPPPGVTPGAAWAETTPSNAMRVPTPGADAFYDIELAPLVNQALAAGKTTMSLHITVQNSSPRFFICYSKDYADAIAFHPYILQKPFDEITYATRTSVQETHLSGYDDTEKDTAFFSNSTYADHFLIGCNNQSKVVYATMLFDPSGLEDAEFVRLRVASYGNVAAGAGTLRVSAWTTDYWSATNLTWNTATPWFPQPASVSEANPPNGLVADIYTTQLKRAGTYFEVDVTASARAAAAAGRMLSIGLFSNYGYNNPGRFWPQFYKSASAYPPVLIFPDPDTKFANKVTCSLDMSGATPALRLAWTALPSGQGEYTVERQKSDGSWKTVASGLSEATCLDGTAEPGISHTYRITGYDAADGSSAAVEATVAFDAKKTVFACADTYVQNGGRANTSFGTAATLVHKYDGLENSGGVREALYRFSLAEMPENFTSATLKLYPTGNAANVSDNAHFDLLKYPDFEWSDASAPAWNDVFGNGWATPQAYGNHPDGKRPLETELGSHIVAESGDITANVPVEFDVADAIRTARAAGDTHVTLHTAAYSSGQWNFGIISRERSQGVSCAPQIVFVLKNWVKRGLVIIIK